MMRGKVRRHLCFRLLAHCGVGGVGRESGCLFGCGVKRIEEVRMLSDAMRCDGRSKVDLKRGGLRMLDNVVESRASMKEGRSPWPWSCRGSHSVPTFRSGELNTFGVEERCAEGMGRTWTGLRSEGDASARERGK